MRIRSVLGTCLVTLTLSLPAVCQAQDSANRGRPITIGERYEIRSEAIGETRGYFVHRPANYDLSTARYPLLIVLDEWNFQLASTTADFLADERLIPAMLVVGIPNTDRLRDLIPQSPPENGAANFLQFITTELIPKLERDFRTQPYRILVGHSNGGLFGLYSLVRAPGAFKGYVLASATLGDGDPELLKTAGSSLEAHPDVAASVYLTLADETDLLSGSWELSALLQKQAERETGWSFEFRHYPEENHGTILLRSLYDGLKFVFDGWEEPDAFALYERGGIAAIDEHYAALSSRFGFDVPAPAGVLLGPTYPLYGQRRIDEAERVILHTLEVYPNDTNALLTAGRLYFDKGDKPKAVDYLTKALLIAPRRRAIGVDYAALDLDPNDVLRGVELSAAALRPYVGTYGSSVSALEIVLRGSNLVAVTSERDNELTALADGRFFFTNGGEVITFRRDDRGRVVALRLQNLGAELAKLAIEPRR